MSNLLERINSIYNPLIFREKDPINRTRIKMLSFLLTVYPIFTLILMIIYLLNGEMAYFIRVALVFLSSLTLLLLINFTSAWRVVSHLVLGICALIIFSNLLVYHQGIDIKTIQYIWFGCMFGFYMHGPKWGSFYAALYILPVLLFTAIGMDKVLNVFTRPEELGEWSYLIVITYNFVLIIFLQYYFFKKFIKVNGKYGSDRKLLFTSWEHLGEDLCFKKYWQGMERVC